MTQHTYTSLAAQARAYAEDYDDEFLAQIPVLIARAENDMTRLFDLSKVDVDGTASLSATTPSATLPSDTLSVRKVWTATNPQLDRKTRSLIDLLRDELDAGAPLYWCEGPGETIEVAPNRPSGATSEVLNIRYVPDVQGLSPSTNSTWLSKHLGDVLLTTLLIEIEAFFKNFNAQQARITARQDQINNLPSELHRMVRRDYKQIESTPRPEMAFGTGT